MTFKTGVWGEQAKKRSESRREYFLEYSRKKSSNGRMPKGDSLGLQGEIEVMKLLGIKRKQRLSEGYDLLWGEYKLDVKTALLTLANKGADRRWKFLLSKQKDKVDYFVFVCKETIDKTVAVFLIPNGERLKDNFSISERQLSKYESYKLKVG